MRCGTIMSRMIAPYRSPTGEMFGATVAENALIEATLAAHGDLTWDFIFSDFSETLNKAQFGPDTKPDLLNLQCRYPSRVRQSNASDYQRVAGSEPSIFVTSAPTFHILADYRQQNNLDGTPICSLVHSLNVRDYYSNYNSLFIQSRSFDVIVASSNTAKQALELTFDGIAEILSGRFQLAKEVLRGPEIVTIPFGVTVPPTELLKSLGLRQQLNIPPDRFVALYLGRISEIYKADLDILLRALHALKGRPVTAHLIIAGQVDDPVYVRRLRDRANSLGLSEQLTLIENFPEFAKASILSCSDAVVLPVDSIQETFGLAVLEGMAFGKPVIASSWSGYRDLVVDGTTGYLIGSSLSAEQLDNVSAVWPLTDARKIASHLAQGTILDERELVHRLYTLMEAPRLAAMMGSAGRTRVEELYAWPKIASKFYNLWRDRLGVASTLSTVRKNRLNYRSIFEHYADRLLKDDSVVTVARPSHSAHKSANLPARMSDLLARIEEENPKVSSIGDLKAMGFQLADILALLKKGFVAVV